VSVEEVEPSVAWKKWAVHRLAIRQPAFTRCVCRMNGSRRLTAMPNARASGAGRRLFAGYWSPCSRARGDRVGSEKRISVETVIGSKERSSPPPVERRRVDLSRTIAICRPIAPPNSAVLGPVAVMTAAYEPFNPAQASVHSTGPRGLNVVAISFKASDR
jgi:hypothetical protein